MSLREIKEAFEVSTKNGAVAIHEPRTLKNRKDGREATVAKWRARRRGVEVCGGYDDAFRRRRDV